MPPPLREAAALGISYRPTGDEDLPFLFEVYASTRTEELAVTGWPDETKRAFLAQQFDAQHAHYRLHYPEAEWLAIELEGEPAGRLYVEEWPSQIRLIDIALLPRFRGAGTGSAIMADLLRWASDKRKPVTLNVEQYNPAMRLYRRLGFVPLDDGGVYQLMEWRPPGAISP